MIFGILQIDEAFTTYRSPRRELSRIGDVVARELLRLGIKAGKELFCKSHFCHLTEIVLDELHVEIEYQVKEKSTSEDSLGATVDRSFESTVLAYEIVDQKSCHKRLFPPPPSDPLNPLTRQPT